MIEIIAVVLLIGALALGFKIGVDSGTKQLAESQAAQMESALNSENDFFQKTGLHGSYLLAGHEYRHGAGYVFVRYSDLQHLLQRQDE